MEYDHVITEIGLGDANRCSDYVIGVPCNIKEVQDVGKGYVRCYARFDPEHKACIDHKLFGMPCCFARVKLAKIQPVHPVIDLNDGWSDEE